MSGRYIVPALNMFSCFGGTLSNFFRRLCGFLAQLRNVLFHAYVLILELLAVFSLLALAYLHIRRLLNQ
jgi:hypothetical protein